MDTRHPRHPRRYHSPIPNAVRTKWVQNTTMDQLCPVSRWRSASNSNRGHARLIIIDDYRHQGLGHLMMGLSKWLQLVLQLAPAWSVRFAFCLPRAVVAAWPELAASSIAHPRAPVALCKTNDFDPHDFVSFDGIRDFRPADDDFSPSHENIHLLQRPTCEVLRTALTALDASQSSSRRLLLVKLAHLRELRHCLDPRDPEAEACLHQHLRLSAPAVASTMSCDVGLQLRTLALDDERCNLLERKRVDYADGRGETIAALSACRGLAARRSSRVSFRCGRTRDRYPRGIEDCPGVSRFATTDKPALFAATRRTGWRDLGEIRPVNPLIQRNESSRSAQATVTAWATLAGCTQGIVSPLPSAFALSASIAAGVPLVGCCSHLRACLHNPTGTKGCFNLGSRRFMVPSGQLVHQ